MRKVYVRFLFKNTSHALDVTMTENEAKEVIKQWRDGLGGTKPKLGHYDRDTDRHWTLDPCEVCCIFTRDKLQEDAQLAAAQRAQAVGGRPSMPPSWGGADLSGGNN